MKSISIVFIVVSVLILSACERIENEKSLAPESLTIRAVGYDDLPGWEEDDHAAAIVAFQKSCKKLLSLPAEKELGTEAFSARAGDWRDACLALKSGDVQDDVQGDFYGRTFFERYFDPYLAASSKFGEEGLFTGYFEAELRGSRHQSAAFPYPLYARPDDLVQVNLGQFSEDMKGQHIVGQLKSGKLIPYPTRGEIESGHFDQQDLALFWIDDAVDLFLLQVQGSGRIILEDGSSVRVGYAAHNGRPYKSIGRDLIKRGELAAGQASWDDIKGWIAAHPDQAAALFSVNPRFIFFREIAGDGPIGAQGVALTPERSLAVDRRFVPLGLPIWLDIVRPGGSIKPLQTLMISQDTGGAIKGPVRGDFFWGYGAEALKYAGVMQSTGRYYLLLPKTISARLSAS